MSSPKQVSLKTEGPQEEVEFWRDFISWWELRHGLSSTERMKAALTEAEKRCHSHTGDVSPVRFEEDYFSKLESV